MGFFLSAGGGRWAARWAAVLGCGGGLQMPSPGWTLV